MRKPLFLLLLGLATTACGDPSEDDANTGACVWNVEDLPCLEGVSADQCEDFADILGADEFSWTEQSRVESCDAQREDYCSSDPPPESCP